MSGWGAYELVSRERVLNIFLLHMVNVLPTVAWFMYTNRVCVYISKILPSGRWIYSWMGWWTLINKHADEYRQQKWKDKQFSQSRKKMPLSFSMFSFPSCEVIGTVLYEIRTTGRSWQSNKISDSLSHFIFLFVPFGVMRIPKFRLDRRNQFLATGGGCCYMATLQHC